MKDQKTLAYINLFGILGALGKLAELDDAARALLTGIKPISDRKSTRLNSSPSGQSRMPSSA